MDTRLTRTRESLARLAQNHAENETLDDGTFEAAAQPLRDNVSELQKQSDKLISTYRNRPGRWDEKAFKRVSGEVLNRLEEMDFSDRQRLIALLD